MTASKTKSAASNAALTQDLDVIIIGGGMSGMTLALALASGGLRPALVDLQAQGMLYLELFRAGCMKT